MGRFHRGRHQWHERNVAVDRRHRWPISINGVVVGAIELHGSAFVAYTIKGEREFANLGRGEVCSFIAIHFCAIDRHCGPVHSPATRANRGGREDGRPEVAAAAGV
jgi:hypothetical protein